MARERLMKRYQDRNPDKKYGEDESLLYSDIDSELGEMDEFKSKTTAVNKRLVGVLRSYPEVAKFIRDISKGSSIEEALARNFDLEAIKPIEGEANYDEWNKGLEDRKTSLKEADDYREGVNSNAQVSAKTMETFIANNKISEDKALEFAEMVDAILMDAVDGKIEEATLTALYTAVTHDEVLSNEVEKATVGAKNAIIKDEMAQLEANKKGDGMPNIAPSGKAKKKKTVAPQSSWEDAIDSKY